MKKIVLLFFMFCATNLFAQEDPIIIFSGGLVKHEDARSQKMWKMGQSIDLRVKIKRTDFGAMFLEIAYLKSQLKSKYKVSGKPSHKSSLITGFGSEINTQLKPFNLNWYFSVGIMHDKEPTLRQYYGSYSFIEKKNMNLMYYFNSSIGMSHAVTKNLGIGINTGFLFSIHGEARGLWFPVTMDTRIYF